MSTPKVHRQPTRPVATHEKKKAPARAKTKTKAREAVRAAPDAVELAPKKRPSVGAAVPVAAEKTPLSGGARMHYVKVNGAAADVMVPASAGSPTESFKRWAKALERADVFGGSGRKDVQRLTQVQTSPGVAARGDRPRIGVLVHDPYELNGPHENIDNIVKAIERVGARAVLIPPMADIALGDDPVAREQAMASMLRELDGLVGPGGPDLHPRLYREPVDGAEREFINYPRDEFEARVVRRAMDETVFTFGICRSHQLVNVVAGGSLVQDMLAEEQVSVSHRMADQGQEHGEIARWETRHGPLTHRVETRGELRDLVGVNELPTNSVHHQSVDGAGPGMEVVGSIYDLETGKTVIESTRRWNVFTVQFHPEYRLDSPESVALFDTLKRSWAFYFADQIRQQGGAPTVEEISRRLEGAKVSLSAVDQRWLEEELVPQLA